MRLHISQVFYSSSQKGAFSSLCRIFQKIVQKKKIRLVSQSVVHFSSGPVFNTSHRESIFSCAFDGEVKNGSAKPNCASNRKTTGKIVFCCLSPQWDLQPAFIFNVFLSKVFAMKLL